jgi:hypothetical protein
MNEAITGFVVNLSDVEVLNVKYGKPDVVTAKSLRVLFSAYTPGEYVGFAQVEAKPIWAPLFYCPKNRVRKLISIPRSFQDLWVDDKITHRGVWRDIRSACDAYVGFGANKHNTLRQALIESGAVASDSPQWLADRLNLFNWRWYPYVTHFRHREACEGTLWVLDFLGAAQALKEACVYNKIEIDLDRLAKSLIRKRPLELAGLWDDKSQDEARRFLSCTETRMLQKMGRGVRRVRG